MRRTHLRGHQNIFKRLVVHAAGFNLGLLMRTLIGVGKPRRLQGAASAALVAALWVIMQMWSFWHSVFAPVVATVIPATTTTWFPSRLSDLAAEATLATDC
jgi:transposase